MGADELLSVSYLSHPALVRPMFWREAGTHQTGAIDLRMHDHGLQQREPGAGLEYAVTVSIEKERMRPPFQGWVMIHTDHPRYPKFQIPVSVASGGGVVVRPTALTLAAQPDNVPQRRMLIVYPRTAVESRQG